MSMQSIVPLQTTAHDTTSSPEVDVCSHFQVIYLHDDADHSVEVVDTPSLQFQELLQFLRSGGSLFIICKPPERVGRVTGTAEWFGAASPETEG